MSQARQPSNDLDHRLEETRRIVTPTRLAIAFLIVLSLGIGAVAFLIEPVYIIVVLLAVMLAFLILLYPYFGLLVYYVLLVIKPAVFVPQLAVFHPERVIGGLLLASLLIHKRFRGERIMILGERMNVLFLLFTLALLFSIPLSYWPTMTFWTVIDFLKICVFYFMIVNVVTDEKRLKGFIWLYMIMAGYNAISSAIAYFMGNVMFAQGIERAESLSGTDPNTLAVNLILGLPFMLFSLGWITNKWLRILPIVCAASAIFTISLTGSRSGILGLLAVMFWVWTTMKKKNKLIFAAALVVLLVVGWIVLPGQYRERYSSITSSEFDPSTVGRLDAWEAGLSMFVARPFFGVGAGTFGVAYASGDFSERRSWLKAHSMYIQIIAEIGLFGLFAFGALVYYMLRQNFRLRRRIREISRKRSFVSYVSYSITCATGALFVTAIFGHSLFRGYWYWAAALTVVMWNLTDKHLRKTTKGSESDEPTIRRTLPR